MSTNANTSGINGMAAGKNRLYILLIHKQVEKSGAKSG
jgi:hypothetical protein